MTAISPGWIRLRRVLVRPSTRARPAAGLARRPTSLMRLRDLDVDVGIASSHVVVHLRPEGEDPWVSDHGEGSEDSLARVNADAPQVDHDHREVAAPVRPDGDPQVGISTIELILLDPDDPAGDRGTERRVRPEHDVG